MYMAVVRSVFTDINTILNGNTYAGLTDYTIDPLYGVRYLTKCR